MTMNNKVLLIVYMCCFFQLDKIIAEQFFHQQIVPSFEKRLIKQLTDDYVKAGKIGRPVKNTKETIVVRFGLSLFQLLELNEKNQVLTVNVWAKYTWVDQLLRWDPKNYSNIKEVRIPPDRVWTPDIVLYDFVDERLNEQRDVMLNVDYMGHVFWSPPAIFKSRCQVNIQNFPFDYQYCVLKFASRTQHSEELDLRFIDNLTQVDMDQYTQSNEWIIEARPALRFITMSEDCTKKIPNLSFFLFLKRNSAYYAYLLVLPCIFLSLLTTVVFWLPPTVSAKMLLGMNIFVAFSLLLKFLTKTIPSASTIIPYLGHYYCINMILVSVSTMFTTVVLNLHQLGLRNFEIPTRLYQITQFFAKVVMIERSSKSNLEITKLSEIEAELDRNAELQTPSVENSPIKGIRKSKSSKSKSNPDWPNNGDPYNQYQHRRLPRHMTFLQQWPQEYEAQMSEYYYQQFRQNYVNWRPEEEFESEKHPSDENANVGEVRKLSATRTSTNQIQTNMAALKTSLRNLMIKIKIKDNKTAKFEKWKLTVMTIDRVFFWIYLVIILGTGLYLLYPRPPYYSVDEIIKNHRQEYINAAQDCLLQ